MLLATSPRGGITYFARLLFGQSDQFLDIVGWETAVGQHDKGARCHVDNGRQIFDRVVGCRIQIGRNGDGRISSEQQVITIGRGLGHKISTNHAAGTGLVFHNHRLFPKRAEFLRQDAAINIRRATRRKGHNDLDWLGRKSLTLSV